ncbi:MAG: CPBP family intramembrane metalloprotease [Burkholderiales bacterium]|nr:CPBP family intramembrane metalloprotease [Burkholderiales bacterium]
MTVSTDRLAESASNTSFADLLKRLGQWHPLMVVVCASLGARLLDTAATLLESLGPAFAFGGPDAAVARMGVAEAVLKTVIGAAAIETALFQALPILALRKFTRLTPPWIVGLTAILFGAIHAPYSWAYMVVAACAGVVLSTVYLARVCGNGSAFLLTFGVHAINNGIELLILKLGQ